MPAWLTSLIFVAVALSGCVQPVDEEPGEGDVPNVRVMPSRESWTRTPDPVLVAAQRLVGFEPQIPTGQDTDQDGLTDIEESWWALDPYDWDTDGDSLSDGLEIANRWIAFTADRLTPGTDSDRDGLPDAAEVNWIGTSPNSRSTDGDEYSDGLEYWKQPITGYDTKDRADLLQLPGYVRGGPLVPDVPDLVVVPGTGRIVLEQEMKINERTLTEGSQISGITSTHESSKKREKDTEVGYETKAEASIGLFKGLGASASASGYAKGSTQWTKENSWTMAATKSFADERTRTWESFSSTDYGKTRFEVPMTIYNRGTDDFRGSIQDLRISFYLGTVLIHAWQESNSTFTGLAAGESAVATLVSVPLAFQDFKAFATGTPIRAEVEHLHYGASQESLRDAISRSVIIEVDNGYDPVFRHVVTPPQRGATLEAVYSVFGDMTTGPVTRGDGSVSTEIVSIDGYGVTTSAADGNASGYSYWTLAFSKNPSGKYPIIADNAAETVLVPGDHVTLRYDRDRDGDGLADRTEDRLGTNPMNIDTDGDGVDDGVELERGLDPLDTDSDGDGIEDGQEVSEGTETTPSRSVDGDDTFVLQRHSSGSRYACTWFPDASELARATDAPTCAGTTRAIGSWTGIGRMQGKDEGPIWFNLNHPGTAASSGSVCQFERYDLQAMMLQNARCGILRPLREVVDVVHVGNFMPDANNIRVDEILVASWDGHKDGSFRTHTDDAGTNLASRALTCKVYSYAGSVLVLEGAVPCGLRGIHSTGGAGDPQMTPVYDLGVGEQGDHLFPLEVNAGASTHQTEWGVAHVAPTSGDNLGKCRLFSHAYNINVARDHPFKTIDCNVEQGDKVLGFDVDGDKTDEILVMGSNGCSAYRSAGDASGALVALDWPECRLLPQDQVMRLRSNQAGDRLVLASVASGDIITYQSVQTRTGDTQTYTLQELSRASDAFRYEPAPNADPDSEYVMDRLILYERAAWE